MVYAVARGHCVVFATTVELFLVLRAPQGQESVSLY
jgi:hypothetical protein